MATTIKQLLLVLVIALNVFSIIVAVRKGVTYGVMVWVLGALLSLAIGCIP